MTSLPYRAAALMLLSCVALSAQAQDLTGRLASIKTRNTIVLGYRESSVPYSYYDNNERVIGYSQDIAQEIVKEIKTTIGAPGLQVKMIPVNAQNRIALVQNGTIDLECGGTTNNKERAQQVDFSNTISVTESSSARTDSCSPPMKLPWETAANRSCSMRLRARWKRVTKS